MLLRGLCASSPALQFVLVNSSILYYNPSNPDVPATERDDCAKYTQKRIFAFRQVRPDSHTACAACPGSAGKEALGMPTPVQTQPAHPAPYQS